MVGIAEVGRIVGIMVGWTEGLIDGSTVGIDDGLDDGAVVGVAEVG